MNKTGTKTLPPETLHNVLKRKTQTVTASMGPRLLYRVWREGADGGTPATGRFPRKSQAKTHIDLFPDQAGNPLARLTRNPDGTLEYLEAEQRALPGPDSPEIVPSRNLPSHWMDLLRPVESEITRRMTNGLTAELDRLGVEGPPDRALREARVSRVTTAQLLVEIYRDATLLTKTKVQALGDAERGIKEQILRHIIDSKTLRFIRDNSPYAHYYITASGSGMNVLKYNTALRNINVLESLKREAPAVFQYFWDHILPTWQRERELAHPGEVTSIVKDNLRLGPAQ